MLGVSPDGQTIVRLPFAGGLMTPPGLWDAATGKHLRDLEGACSWDPASDEPRFQTDPTCREYPDSPFPVFLSGVAWTPDSRLVAITDDWEWPTVGVWDAPSGRLVHTVRGSRGRPVDRLQP